MADVVSEQAAAQPSKREEQALVLARRRAEEKVPRHKFGLAYLLLAALLGAAVGLAVVLLTRSDSTPKTTVAWSAWRPATTGTLGVREIARYISPHYRLAGGQLVGVVAGPMVVPSEQGAIPVSAILVSSGRAGVRQQRIDAAIPQAGVFYQMCGGGSQCAIPGSEATNERGTLVFREAVELALYTFHYLPEADHVLVFLPPPAGVPQESPFFRRLLYFPRAALARELSVPLKATLPEQKTTLKPQNIPANEADAIDGLIAPRLFHYDFRPAPDQSVFVVLSPLPSA